MFYGDIGDDIIEFDCYKTFLLNRETEGGGLSVAVRKGIKNITHIVNEDVSNGEMIWILIDNTKLQLRLGLIYAPQESRSTTVQLEKMYDRIGRQIMQANVKNQHIIILGDFNCK